VTKNQYAVEDVLFPVALHPVFVAAGFRQGNLFYENSSYRQVPGFKAVMAEDNGRVFAVVAQDYGLVTNKEALKLAESCFRAVFKLVKAEDMKVFNVIMPKTRSFCHVDFVHQEHGFNLSPKDRWFPYLRVTNSYNRMFALNFDIGFCRGICWNGVIFGRDNIEFKYHHTRSMADPVVSFEMRAGELVNLEDKFIAALRNLKRFHVPPQVMWPLTCKVFGYRMIEDPTLRQKELTEERKERVLKLRDQYFKELGQNGYAALNVLTDFASRPTAVLSPEMNINSMQKKSGDWVAEFVDAIEERNFDFETYLGEYARLVA
jgi:hypothetical protein